MAYYVANKRNRNCGQILSPIASCINTSLRFFCNHQPLCPFSLCNVSFYCPCSGNNFLLRKSVLLAVEKYIAVHGAWYCLCDIKSGNIRGRQSLVYSKSKVCKLKSVSTSIDNCKLLIFIINFLMQISFLKIVYMHV